VPARTFCAPIVNPTATPGSIAREPGDRLRSQPWRLIGARRRILTTDAIVPTHKFDGTASDLRPASTAARAKMRTCAASLRRFKSFCVGTAHEFN
jgi:hypothetical protein